MASHDRLTPPVDRLLFVLLVLRPTSLPPCSSTHFTGRHGRSLAIMAPPQQNQQAPSPPTGGAGGGEEDELDRLGSDLNSCLMSVYAFTVVGVGVGTGVGIARKSLLPLVGCGAVGSIGDLFYGLGYVCKPKLDAYRACRERRQPPQQRGPPPLPQQPTKGGKL